MRIALLASLLMLLAGCAEASDDSTDDPTDDPSTALSDASPAPAAAKPADLHVTQTVDLAVDPGNQVGLECTLPTARCFDYRFTLHGKTDMDARLAWALPANDFDLYLYEGETSLLQSSAGATTEESFATTLGGGDYRIVVIAWAAAQETFTLDAEFSA